MTGDVFHFPKKVIEDTLGTELCERYHRIMPLLLLIQYRLHTLFGDYKKTRQRILEYDYAPDDLPTEIFNTALSIAGRDKPGIDKKYILLSKTLSDNPRYNDAFSWLCKNRNIAIPQRIVATKKNILKNVRQSDEQYLVFTRKSILGSKLADAILNYQDCAYRLYNEERCSIEAELFMLEKLYLERVEYLKSLLTKQQIECFITINQYNAPDLIICDCCNELGIITKQAEHHTLKYSDFDSSKNLVSRLTFVNQHLFWADSDLDINKNIYKYYPAFNQTVEFLVAGSLELVYEAISQNIEGEVNQQYLTLMLSDIPTDDKEVEKSIISWRTELFSEVKKLSDKNSLPVRVRYKPGSTLYREYDAEIFALNDFKVSESTAENLHYDILSSRYIISTPSSVVELCGYLGRQACTVSYPLLEGGEPNLPDSVPNYPINRLIDIDVDNQQIHKKSAYIDFNILTEV